MWLFGDLGVRPPQTVKSKTNKQKTQLHLTIVYLLLKTKVRCGYFQPLEDSLLAWAAKDHLDSLTQGFLMIFSSNGIYPEPDYMN